MRNEELTSVIRVMNCKSAPGHDIITINDILIAEDVIIPVLFHLINGVLESDDFPRELILTKVTPVYKKGDPDLVNNYRPIAVVSTFSKICEAMIKKRMESFLYKYGCFGSGQHGFMANSSTTTAIADYTENLQRYVNEGNITVLLFIYYSKAFDTVDYKTLLTKLDSIGFRGTCNRLLSS